MKFLTIIIIFLSLLNLLSCKDRNSVNKGKFSKVDLVDSDMDSTKQLTTHIIDVKCEGEFIPLRQRILTKKELELSQKGNAIAKQLNDEVIIDKLYNGEWIKILKADTLGYHYIQVVDRINSTELDEQRDIRGYILTKYCNKPTVRKFERLHISEFDNASDDVKGLIEFLEYHVPNGNLLDYAYTFVSDEADLIQTFSFNVTGNNTIRYKLYQVLLQSDAILWEGEAELYTRYKKGEIEFSKYVTRNLTGTDFEIHINERDKTATLKFIDKKMLFFIEEGLIMKRIK
jgi:hypothetical protein